jgi:hypothetical protein
MMGVALNRYLPRCNAMPANEFYVNGRNGRTQTAIPIHRNVTPTPINSGFEIFQTKSYGSIFL